MPGSRNCAPSSRRSVDRRIIADYLLAAGESVGHIMAPHEVEPAQMTAGAQRTPAGSLIYPAAAPAQGMLDL